jgi:uncharacterized protein YjiK
MLSQGPVQTFLNMHSISLLSILVLFSCINNEPDEMEAMNYDLGKPDIIYVMPEDLKEISGIYMVKENELVCIEDNHGFLYFYDTQQKKITDKIEFEPTGDYEDVTMVGNEYYVLRSDGVIQKISADKEVVTYKTSLNSKNNPEGLCFDKKNNCLLIACKDEGGSNLKKHQKGIYSFSLQTKSLSEAPTIIVDLPKYYGKKNHKHVADFSPSGIAIHPLTNHIFLISAKGNDLVELNENGDVLFIETLSDKLFSQPEGICFSGSGDLHISNEGKSGQANILRFKAK